MPAIFPVVEGEEQPDFNGRLLSEYYDTLVAIAEKGGFKSINNFEYFDDEMIEEFGIEFDEAQHEWHSPADGIDALTRTIHHPDLPPNEDLKEELQDLVSILQKVPLTSKGWRLQQDI
ncbi:MAG: hypothetical protein ABI162_12010 [Luteolibacter sp.]